MNILITGSTGFIGKHLVATLNQKGVSCKCLVRDITSAKKQLNHLPDIEFIEGDITKPETLTNIESNFDCVFHLAACLGDKKFSNEIIMQTNCQGTKNLLKKVFNCKLFIFCSTPGVQGFGHKEAIEELPYNPRGIYEKSKMLAEKVVIEECKKKNLNWIILRPDFIYGPGDFRRIPLYKQIKKKKMFILGNGSSAITPTYIDDVISAFESCMTSEKAKNQIFNISAKTITVTEYLSTIANALNESLPNIRIPLFVCNIAAFFSKLIFCKILKKDPILTKSKIDFLTKDHGTSNAKAKQFLNFEPNFSFEKGIKQTINWYNLNNLI